MSRREPANFRAVSEAMNAGVQRLDSVCDRFLEIRKRAFLVKGSVESRAVKETSQVGEYCWVADGGLARKQR